MPGSQAAVYTALSSLVASVLPAAQLVTGATGTYQASQTVLLGDFAGNDTPQLLMGGAPEQYAESYDVTLVVRAFKGGDTPGDALTTAVGMKDAIRDGLAADMTLGGVVQQAYLASYRSQTGVDDPGVASEITLTVHVSNLT